VIELGRHWEIVAAAWAITALALGGLSAAIVLDGRRRKAELARLEALAPRRRAAGERA
jgi:heme exporter protein D